MCSSAHAAITRGYLVSEAETNAKIAFAYLSTMSVQQADVVGIAGDPNEQPQFVQDPDIWLDDGNIVIAAGTEPTRLFKCHRSVLCGW